MAERNSNNLAMDGRERRRQLGGFLRECRERIGPEAVALPATGRRRTPGLRREEVASLVDISTTYYTKIEQGTVDVSGRVLNDIVDVLKLTHTERNYVFALATGRTPVQIEEYVSPILMRLLELHEPYPAQILGRRWDFLAWNEAANDVLTNLEEIPPQARNLIYLIAMNPEVLDASTEPDLQVQRILAEFRADYGRYHNDPAFGELIATLKAESALFNKWWDEYKEVGALTGFDYTANHPIAGRINLLALGLNSNDYPGLRIMLFLPQDDEAKEKLHQLYKERMDNR